MRFVPRDIVLLDRGRPPRELVEGNRLGPSRYFRVDEALGLFKLPSLLRLTRRNLLEPRGILLPLRVGPGHL